MPALPPDYAYIPDTAFDALVESLLHPEPSLDPRGDIAMKLIAAGIAPLFCYWDNQENEAA
ncbi:hypothetical protein [Pseudotabrizicola alkalilacus]|uniref:Uncharacterized protein n=1 Tax=Pseudotabrizicola alkalilacus TaxID=2305252 RepID=A0A411Z3T4_9RHOB|nr:hypothetical protein [Pseudotabrizicola alkalilacus]RGP37690.1 hypothetical protein D1012_07160 [Pseudotabrizicola alkalilacus]